MSPNDGGLVIFRMSTHLKRSETKFSVVETMTNESFSRTGQVLDIQGRWNRMFSEGPNISDWEIALCEFLFSWDTFVKSRGPRTWFGPRLLVSDLFQRLTMTVTWGQMKPGWFFPGLCGLGHNRSGFCARLQRQNAPWPVAYCCSIHQGQRKIQDRVEPLQPVFLLLSQR